jgi:osmotically-inducible protein OsmY
MTARPARRADAEIFAEARHALDSRPTVPEGVRVHVDQGTVTLTGSVQRPSERAEAEQAVRPIEGVQRIMNDIVVTQVPHAVGFEPPDDRE